MIVDDMTRNPYQKSEYSLTSSSHVCTLQPVERKSPLRLEMDRAIEAYLRWLRVKPYVSRAVTRYVLTRIKDIVCNVLTCLMCSALLSSLGPTVSHLIVHKSFVGMPLRRTFAYACYG